MTTPIRIHPGNPRLFEFRGKPRALVTATEHYGAVINRPFRYDRYLEDAADKRMTLSRLFLLFRELQSPRNPHSTCKPDSSDYVTPFPRTGPGRATDGEPKYDLDRWNPEYFERLHGFLSLASRHGIVVEVTVFSNTYGDGVWALNPLNRENNINDMPAIPWPDYLSLRHPALVARQMAFVRKVVSELNAYDNIYFEICNEPGGKADVPGSPSPDDVNAWQRQIAGLIREMESSLPNQHLVAGQGEMRSSGSIEGTIARVLNMPLSSENKSGGDRHQWGERHLITKLFEAADGAALDALMVTLVKVVFTQVSIGLLARKQVVSNDQNRVPNRHQRPFRASPSGNPVILCLQIRMLAARGTMRGFGQGGAQPTAPLAGLARLAFARAFIVARTHAGPGGQVFRALKRLHIYTDLRDQHFGNAPTDAGNRVQTLYLGLKRAHLLCDLRVQPLDGLVQMIDLTEQLRYHHPMMRLQPAR